MSKSHYVCIYKGEHNYDIKTLSQSFLVIACCFVVFYIFKAHIFVFYSSYRVGVKLGFLVQIYTNLNCTLCYCLIIICNYYRNSKLAIDCTNLNL